MDLQFLSDGRGRTTAVQMSLEDWERIKSLYPDIEYLSGDLPAWQKDLLDMRLKAIAENPDRIRPGSELFDEL
ncbi:addiction module protein [Pararcticibacter amylolyticus]|uniref:Addiction module component CHP02574 family protein n=1 Tax=Pararcticibacter amylolyticus TaxID=2173175 RepID=A0A2U2PD44_9SPHI|nr:addiction module protein [Pararcticibacter amylolyticus]PWG79316.1 addiction module component CHP02574 family protein [Pararcticibacter amylolyticus]